MGKFSQKIRSFKETATAVTEEVAIAAGIELVRSVIADSPLDTGRFVGNWIASTSSPVISVSEITKTKEEAIGDVLPVIETLRLDETFFLSNSLPYSHRLEYEGWSKKAPQGMVRINVQRIANNIRAGR